MGDFIRGSHLLSGGSHWSLRSEWHCQVLLRNRQGQGGRPVHLTHQVRTIIRVLQEAQSQKAESVDPGWVWERVVTGGGRGISDVRGQCGQEGSRR